MNTKILPTLDQINFERKKHYKQDHPKELHIYKWENRFSKNQTTTTAVKKKISYLKRN